MGSPAAAGQQPRRCPRLPVRRGVARFRIKRWDYNGVTLPDRYFSATIADLGYAGQVFVYMVDFTDGSYVEDTITIPFGKGVDLPRNSDAHAEGLVGWAEEHQARR